MSCLSNRIYKEYMYNKPVKDRFLENIAKESADSTITSYKRILKRVSTLEKNADKDLYDFSLQEIERFLIKLNPTSTNSAINAITLIDNYIKWGIGQHLSKGNINPLDIFKATELAERVVNKRIRNIFSYDEIQDVIADTVNFQDSALIMSLFFGILGKQLSEVSNLRIQDIDTENKKIHLRGIESERILKIETEEHLELVELLSAAYDQSEYIKNNGVAGKMKNPRLPLVRNDHIFRPMARVTRSGDIEQVATTASYFVLRKRIAYLADIFDMPGLNTINIRNSGIVYMAYQEYKANNEQLTRESKNKIYDFYNMGKLKATNEYQLHGYERDYINVETIRELYYGE